MSEYDEYLRGTIMRTEWGEQKWEERKEMFADVWEQRCEQDQKELIALLMAHAPECISEPTCQWPTERFNRG